MMRTACCYASAGGFCLHGSAVILVTAIHSSTSGSLLRYVHGAVDRSGQPWAGMCTARELCWPSWGSEERGSLSMRCAHAVQLRRGHQIDCCHLMSSHAQRTAHIRTWWPCAHVKQFASFMYASGISYLTHPVQVPAFRTLQASCFWCRHRTRAAKSFQVLAIQTTPA